MSTHRMSHDDGAPHLHPEHQPGGEAGVGMSTTSTPRRPVPLRPEGMGSNRGWMWVGLAVVLGALAFGAFGISQDLDRREGAPPSQQNPIPAEPLTP